MSAPRSRRREASAGLPFWGRPVAGVLAACLAALMTPTGARAPESPVPTAQQVSYGGAWLPFVDPAELPPVAERPAVCLVDSGVAVSDDLPADRVEGPIIARRSVVAGEDATPGVAFENQHGTYTALMIGAQRNGSGTVGAVPWARIISVKAMGANERNFTAAAYVKGTRACRQEIENGGISVASVNLSFGCGCFPSQEESDLLEVEVKRLRRAGALVLASAGNRHGEPIGYPASQRGVIAVAAGDAQGALCDYGSYGTQALIGPACAIDTAEDGQPIRTSGGGSSSAAAFTSALAAAVKTFVPKATSAELETWLRQGARFVGGRPVVDAEGFFRAAGLGDIVDRAKARQALTAEPAPPAPTPAAPGPVLDLKVVLPPKSTPPGRKLVAYSVKASWRRGRVTVTVRGRPRGVRVEVVLERASAVFYRGVRKVIRASSKISVKAAGRPARLRVRLLLSDGRKAPLTYLYATLNGYRMIR